MFQKPPIRLLLTLLVAVAALGLAFAALRPREPVYNGKRLSAWIEELSRPQDETEGLAGVQFRWQELTNVVRAVGAQALPLAVGWIHDKPRSSRYHDLQYRIERALAFRIHLPDCKDRSGDAIWVFQILGPEGKEAIPDLARLTMANSTCHEAAYCLSMIGPTAVPALRDAVANGTPRTRSAAIDGLAEIGHPAVSTAPLLNQIAQTNDPSTWQALRALAEIQTNTASLLPVLLEHLQDPGPLGTTPYDFGAAPGAAYALARLGSAGVPALLESLTSTQAVVRASAIAAFDPAFQEMLSGKKPSNFYARSGHFQSAFIREMTSEATATTMGQYPDAYYHKLLRIAQQYTPSTNEAICSAASKVVNYVNGSKGH